MTALTDPVVLVGVAGLTVCVGLFVGFALAAVRHTSKVVKRAERIAALPAPEPGVDWAAWDEVFS